MQKTLFENPIFVALDTPDVDKALALGESLKGKVGGLKLGLEFFMANGPQAVAQLSALDLPIFLDLKLHDIPNTVAGALRSLAPLAPAFITLHAQGGAAMMEAAAKTVKEEADKLGTGRPLLLGVTILTSLDSDDLKAQGGDGDVSAQVERLATLAQSSKIDGIVCSPFEVAAMRNILGEDAYLIVPGIRPAGAATGDQKRVMTPSEALDAGADILVIGRPITQADDPAEAAAAIAAELV